MPKITGGVCTVTLNTWNYLEMLIANDLESRLFLFMCSVLNVYTRQSLVSSAQNSTFKNAGKVHGHEFHPHYSLLRGIN